MSQQIWKELTFLLASYLDGFVIMAMYDLLRALSCTVKFRKSLKHWLDVFFFASCGFGSYAVLYHINEGEVRGLFWLMMATGMIFYRCGPGVYLFRLEKIIFRFIVGALKKLAKMVKIVV
ncbi:MAG: spore cortex biosynthesis protein YabQ [Lachnospiraceae bacterium]|nr:spore cortex biosynthesis protein YabQ [Lachnospiraceae bacterium]